jgi:hypothetical protein
VSHGQAGLDRLSLNCLNGSSLPAAPTVLA